jgi:hypothetical protein
MKKDKNNHEIDLDKYKDSNGLSLEKMNFGLWFSESRKKITKVIIVILIAISIFFFLYSSYNFVIYFSTNPDDNAIVSSVSSPRNLVSDLVAGVPRIFKNGDSYDLISTLSNPNSKFVAHFKYCFANEAGDINCGASFIFPGEEKYLSALGQKISVGSAAVSLRLSEISWQRVNNHKIPDWNSFAGEHLNFNLENIKLNLDSDSSSGGKTGLDSLEFTITNRTAFSYYEVPLNIVFYRDSEIIGANKTIMENFLTGASRTIRLSWLSSLSGVTRTDIRPELNLLDDSIYLKYQGVQ